MGRVFDSLDEVSLKRKIGVSVFLISLSPILIILFYLIISISIVSEQDGHLPVRIAVDPKSS